MRAHQRTLPLVAVALLLAAVVMTLPWQEREPQPRPVRSLPAKVILPDFSQIWDVHTRKVRFFEFLLPLVQEENLRLAEIRRRLELVQDIHHFDETLDFEDSLWMLETLDRFGVDPLLIGETDFWPELMKRVDLVPENLVLVQAANESAWGTSRFAREGNNLFGQWCFRPGCGMVPEGRNEGETFEVARFESVRASIAGYMHNLNTGFAYEVLREIRAETRRSGRTAQAQDLAVGLKRYSQRGEQYVQELQAMLRVNAPIINKLRSVRPGQPEA